MYKLKKTFFFIIADMAGNWYEDLQKYESNLDEMASATLDQVKKRQKGEKETRHLKN